MKWNLVFLPEADDDLGRLDNGVRLIVLKAIKKVQKNPLPREEGGYGKRLGHKQNMDLSGFLKIKIRDIGVRVVYALERRDNQMVVVVIGARKDNIVYKTAALRINKL